MDKLMPQLIHEAKRKAGIVDIFYEIEKSVLLKSMPFGKMIYAKLDAANIKLQPDLAVIIFLLTGNPGTIQLMLKEILMMDKARKKVKCHEIVTILDVEDYKYFNPEYEDKENEILKDFEPKWNAQKDYTLNNFSSNKCDTIEWWMEIYD